MTELAGRTNETPDRVSDLLMRYRDPVIDRMRLALDRPGIDHIRLMRYHLGWVDEQGNAIESVAGKMLRPALCLLCCEAVGGDLNRGLPAAVAIELLHNFTLIHDDIEDESQERHGRPTLWRVAGLAQAINAGDGMFVLAQRTLLDLEGAGTPASRVLEASRRLNDACITLCEGQYADLSFEARRRVTYDEYEAMIGGKTSALLAASASIGALAGGADGDTLQAFRQYGFALGIAFQMQDDMLGVWGAPNLTGKSTADDIRARKKSYPIVYALERLDPERVREFEEIYAGPMDDSSVETVLALLDTAGARQASREAAQRWAQVAMDAIASLDLATEKRADLGALARFVVERQA